LPPVHLIPSLEPKLRALYDRHRERAKAIDWAYHEYLPLDELRADPQSLPKLSAVTYLAVETALFTEVNLPWFTTGLSNVFKGALSPMQEFIHDWTAEEDQHAMLLETYLLLGDNGDHRERARLRKIIVRQGWAPGIEDHFQAIAYTATQELATRAFYQRVAVECRHEDPLLARALNRLAKDETLHYAFYRDAVKAHLEVEPDYAEPLAKILMGFSMPGTQMPDYAARSALLAREGVYGPDHYFNMVVDHLWKEWDIGGLNPKADGARAAQKTLIAHHEKLGRIAARFAARRKASSTETTPSARPTGESTDAINQKNERQRYDGRRSAMERDGRDGIYSELVHRRPDK
jgi:acyl-[acyl-carrier-protein] desaturase